VVMNMSFKNLIIKNCTNRSVAIVLGSRLGGAG